MVQELDLWKSGLFTSKLLRLHNFDARKNMEGANRIGWKQLGQTFHIWKDSCDRINTCWLNQDSNVRIGGGLKEVKSAYIKWIKKIDELTGSFHFQFEGLPWRISGTFALSSLLLSCGLIVTDTR